MTTSSPQFGLSAPDKARLLQRQAQRRSATAATTPGLPAPHVPGRIPLGDPAIVREIEMVIRAGAQLGIQNPFFRPHAGIAGSTTLIEGQEKLNFVSYNYLGLNGDVRVSNAAKAAIDCYGTSVSASRLVSGERPVHGELEKALSAVYGSEDCIVMVSGHATNVTAIGHLVGPDDAILHDALAHNSIVQGALLSRAHRASFAHNDPAALRQALQSVRPRATRILVVVEGHYSMDGDVPDLRAMLPIVREYGAWLMVDEAHSLGVLGRQGAGLAEHLGIEPGEVDIWMGTLSKSLCSCGGYIAASEGLVEYLRYSAPGFVYSVGLPGPAAAAALAALAAMQEEPWRVERLQENAQIFLKAAQKAGLNTGTSIGAGIVPVITGSSIRAARAADILFRRGVNVQPIIHPAVPERSARLRFFLSALHTQAQIQEAVAQTAEVLREIHGTLSQDLAWLARSLQP